MKYLLFFIVLLLLVFSENTFAQRMMIPSEGKRADIVSLSDWSEKELSGYTGYYRQAFYAIDEYGVTSGDDLVISIVGDKPILAFTAGYADGIMNVYDTLYNVYINSNRLFADDFKGRFVEIEYTTGKYNKKTKGVFLYNNERSDVLYFYERK